MASAFSMLGFRGDGEPPERVLLTARLIVRDSCTPPERGKDAVGLKPKKPGVKRLAGRGIDGFADSV